MSRLVLLISGIYLALVVTPTQAKTLEVPQDFEGIKKIISEFQLTKEDCNQKFLWALKRKILELEENKKILGAEGPENSILINNQIRKCRRNKLIN